MSCHIVIARDGDTRRDSETLSDGRRQLQPLRVHFVSPQQLKTGIRIAFIHVYVRREDWPILSSPKAEEERRGIKGTS